MTTLPSSPEYLQTSLAAAMVLGLRPGRFYRDVRPLCINLLLHYPQGCRANCAYCGLARSRPGTASDKSFIRVEWPLLPTEVLFDRIVRYQSQLSRVCLSMVTHPRAYQDTVDLCRGLAGLTELPISALVTPTLLTEARVRELKESGVERLGIALDAATPRIFHRLRGQGASSPHSYERYWALMEVARPVFGPWKVTCHIIVGIGESDQELIELFSRLQERQIQGHLFSFYPEEGSAMARRRRPSLVRWRRMQLVKFLLEQGVVGPEDMGFDARDRLRHLGVRPAQAEAALTSGLPFITGGCPSRNGPLGCTRPFGSYRPGQPFRDFPFHPTGEDLARVRRELRLGELLKPKAP